MHSSSVLIIAAILMILIVMYTCNHDTFTNLPYGDIHSNFTLQPTSYLETSVAAPTTPAAPHVAPVAPVAPTTPAAPMTSPVTTPMMLSSSLSSNGGWNKAYATHYTSYPACCPQGPNYDPSAPKGECKNYSGCKYMGKFAGVKGTLKLEEVRDRNIVAFFKKGDKNAWKRVKGKKLRVRNPNNGNTLEVEALDTCGDNDCNGCCSKNASKGGGVLIDFESHTAQRFWGGKPRNGVIEWQYV
jgi:hypothetical protein